MILVGVSGGVAAYKSCELVRLLVKAGREVQVVMTPAAERFVGPTTFAALSRRPVKRGSPTGRTWSSASPTPSIAIA